MTMTWDDIAELLAFCAVYDKRKGGDLDIKAWLKVAIDHRWTNAAALRVASEHYGEDANRPRLEPPAVTDRIKTIRRRAADTFEAPRIPDDLPNHEYPTWYRAQLAAHVDPLVEHWGHAGTEPPLERAAAAALIRSLAELIAAAPDHTRAELTNGARRIHNRRPA